MNYKMILLDLDATVLRDDKSISPAFIRAVERASAVGKEVVFASGRAVSELYPYNGMLPKVRYAVCGGGTTIWNREKDELVERHCLTAEETGFILRSCRESGLPYMLQAFSNRRNIISFDAQANLERYHMEEYRGVYAAFATFTESVEKMVGDTPGDFERVSPVLESPEAREKLWTVLSRGTAALTRAETSQIETGPPGISKGSGLLSVCRILGIAPEETIAVGDADNDLPMMEAAGLSVAVGNAAERIREKCDRVVADNMHDGAAEAIERFLLS